MDEKSPPASPKMEAESESLSREARGICVIAHPLASDKLTKKCLKLVKKGQCACFIMSFPCNKKSHHDVFIWHNSLCVYVCVFTFMHAAAKTKSIRRGVKETIKAIRKGEKGFVLIHSFIHSLRIVLISAGCKTD